MEAFQLTSIKAKLIGLIVAILIALSTSVLVMDAAAARALEQTIRSVAAYESGIKLALEWKGLIGNNLQRVVAIAVSSDENVAKTFGSQIKATIEEIGKVHERIVAETQDEKAKKALLQVHAFRQPILAMVTEINALKKEQKFDEARSLATSKLMPISQNYLESLQAFIRVQESLRDQARDDGFASVERARMLGGVAIAVVLGLSLLAAWWMVRSITDPLARTVELAQTIARGDLSASLQSQQQDEIGQLMNAVGTMNHKLRELVSQVRSGTQSVTAASTEIAQGNLDLSHRTEQTSSNLQEMAVAIDELTRIVTQSTDSAQRAAHLAQTVSNSANLGGDVVAKVAKNMSQITEHSKHIGDIVGIIDGIAFQTNILALNAAVEAARAGEQGRGFAVVASEVRTLAQRSAQSAKEIKELIQASETSVGVGATLVGQSGDVMREMVQGVQQVSQLIAEIAGMAQSQRDGISQVQMAVDQLDQMTQQNAALVDESAASAHSMNEQAQKLSSLVGQFRL